MRHLISSQYFAHDTGSRLYNQFVLVCVYPLLQVFEIFALLNFNLPQYDGLSAVDLLNDIVHHDTRLVVLKFPCLEVVKRALYSVDSVVFVCIVSAWWIGGCR